MEVGSVQLPFIFTVINPIISAWQSTTPIQSHERRMNAMDLPPFHYRTRIDTIHYQSFEVFEHCTITLPGISITDIVIVILNYFIEENQCIQDRYCSFCFLL